MATIIDRLITDRTVADVERAFYLESLWGTDGTWTGTQAEYDEWLNNPKGEYRASDLRRVKEAIEFVAGELNAAGYTVVIKPMADFTVDAIPSFGVLDVYLENLQTVRSAIRSPVPLPSVPPDMDLLTHEEANDIERILQGTYEYVEIISRSWLRCGQGNLYSGIFW